MRSFWTCAGGCLLGSSAWQLWAAHSGGMSSHAFVIGQLAAGFVYLSSAYVVLRRSETVSFRYVVLVAILCRLPLLSSPALFDRDVCRYLWDGKLVSHGVNPYSHSPESNAYASLRDSNWAIVPCGDSACVHPPLAQSIFGLAHILGVQTTISFKAVAFLFDVATVFAIAAILRLLRLPASRALIYAWSPLVIVQFSGSGHVEVAMLLFLAMAFYFWLKNGSNGRAAGLAYGASLMVNFAGALLAPLAWKLGRWKSLAYTGGIVVVVCLPFAGAGSRLLTATGLTGPDYTFNDGAFRLVSAAVSWVFPEAWSLPISVARVIVAIMIGVYATWAALSVRKTDRIAAIACGRNVFAVCLLLMPVVNPWYVTWLLPWMCVGPSVGLLLFTVTCGLAYFHFAYGYLPTWVLLLEYLPVYFILTAEFWPRRIAKDR